MTSKTMTRIRLVAAAAAIVGVAACTSARRRPPLSAPLSLSAKAQQGQVAFMQNCYKCHPGGEAGLGPALNDKPFPSFLKRFQVRHGLGTMPHFSKEQLPDEKLDEILEYLKALNAHPAASGGNAPRQPS